MCLDDGNTKFAVARNSCFTLVRYERKLLYCECLETASYLRLLQTTTYNRQLVVNSCVQLINLRHFANTQRVKVPPTGLP